MRCFWRRQNGSLVFTSIFKCKAFISLNLEAFVTMRAISSSESDPWSESNPSSYTGSSAGTARIALISKLRQILFSSPHRQEIRYPVSAPGCATWRQQRHCTAVRCTKPEGGWCRNFMSRLYLRLGAPGMKSLEQPLCCCLRLAPVRIWASWSLCEAIAANALIRNIRTYGAT